MGGGMTKSCGRRTPPPRIEARPHPTAWGRDELLTLEEAALLYWPSGPITARTLRTAVRDGDLAVARIAGKLFTSREALETMTKCRPNRGAARPPAEPRSGAGAPTAPPAGSAEALLRLVADERRRLGPPRGGAVAKAGAK